jgi:catechol 2,3-dioxygenase-like lactoylglutathione lyase family enzyme
MAVSRIDHVVVDVRDRIDEAERRYRALGFNLTQRGRHSLRSVNHLAMLDPDYVELLGTGEGGGAARADLAGFPVGMNGLVFAMQDAEALHADQRARGIPVQPVQRFGRPVVLPDASRGEARFNVVRVEPRAVFDGRVYFCEHLTPDLVWRPEWQDHPNGALALARVVLAAEDPDRTAAAFERMFGAGSVEAAADGGRVLAAGGVAVEVRAREAVERALGGAMPDPAGRGDHMALLGVRVRSLRRAEEVLRANGVPVLRAAGRGLLVPAAEAMNVALEFVE